MPDEEGLAGCPGCGAVWKGAWDPDYEVECPECGTVLEPVDDVDASGS